jgi:hypothetical protein
MGDGFLLVAVGSLEMRVGSGQSQWLFVGDWNQ